jgi:hypothetical protein
MADCLWFVSNRQQISTPSVICSQFQLVSSVVCHGTLEQRVFLYGTYVKYGSARKCQQKFWYTFHDEIITSRQTIHNLVNKLRTMGLLIDGKQKHKHRVLTKKLHDTGTRLEHTPRKSLKCLAHETGVSKSNARMATQLLKPSSESWCLVCYKHKKEGCTYVFQRNN